MTRGGDSDPVQEPVERLLFEWLESGASPAALDALCARNPELAVELRGRRDSLIRNGLLESSAGSEPEVMRAFGDYTILRVLGGGGMGIVYAAREGATGREVALKLIRPEQLWFPGRRERFQREADALQKLSHPGIVQVHAIGEVGSIPFVAQEWIQGDTLAARLLALRGRDPRALCGADLGIGAGSCSWVEACLQVARDVARALEHAHERGVLHRDVKPSNVMLTPQGRVVVIDFGLARAVESESLTQTGAAPGSLPYMAPETIAGGHVGFEPRIDVYGVGALLYELLTLVPAFADSNAERLRNRILTGDLVAPRRRFPDLRRDVELVCTTALDVDPRRRYPTIAELAADLDRALVGESVRATPLSRTTRALRTIRRRPWLTAGLLVTLAIAAGVLTPWFWIRDKAEILAAGANAQTLERYEEALAEAMRLYDAGDPREGDRVLGVAEALGVGRGETVGYRIFGLLQRREPERALELVTPLTGGDRRAVASLEAHALESLGRREESTALRSGLPPAETPATLFWDGIDLYFTNNKAREEGRSEPEAEARAFDLLSRSVALSPRPRLHQVCYRLAAAVSVRDQRSILECIEVLERNWPGSGPAWYWIGYAKATFDTLGAMQAYERSLRLQPMREDVHYRLCYLLVIRSRVETAEAGIARFQKCFPNSALASLCEAHLEGRKGRFEAAIVAAQRAIELDPSSANAHCTVATHALRLRKLDLAEQHARTAIALEAGNASAHLTLADCLYFLGRPTEGVPVARSAVDLLEKSGTFPKEIAAQCRLILARLLIARAESGDKSEALGIVTAAVRIDPSGAGTHAFAIELLRKLREREALAAEVARFQAASRPSSAVSTSSRPGSR